MSKVTNPHRAWRAELPKHCPNCQVGEIVVVNMNGNLTPICSLNCDRSKVKPAYRELRESGAPTLPGFGDDNEDQE